MTENLPLGERNCMICHVKIATDGCDHMDNDGERVIMSQESWRDLVEELWLLRSYRNDREPWE